MLTQAGEVAGYSIASRPEMATVHLHHIVVAPRFRSNRELSIGGVFVDNLVRQAREAGANQLTLKVMAENPRALRFYKRRDFVEAPSGNPAVHALALNL